MASLHTAAFLVGPDEDRWGAKTKTSADTVWTKVSEKDTGGAWSTFESRVPAGLAVPLHVHHRQDEWFWVLDGDFVFEVAGETYRLSAGMSLSRRVNCRIVGRRLPARTGGS